MSDADELDDGGQLDPEEAESHFMERVANADVPLGDHTTLSQAAQDDFLSRYNAQED